VAHERSSEQHIFGLKLTEEEFEQFWGVEDLRRCLRVHAYDRGVDAWSGLSGDGRVVHGRRAVAAGGVGHCGMIVRFEW
jgi:hypothetical protein